MRVLAFIPIMALVGCATASQYREPGSGPDVARDVQHRANGRDEVFATNRSTSPIVITGVRLVSCVNVETSCEATHAQVVHLNGGERKLVLRVRAADATRRFRYVVQWNWAPADK